MCMLIYSICPSCYALQLQKQRILDRFKNREDAFFDKLEDDMFPDLYSMRDYAQKTHLLAAKWGIGTAKMELWRAHTNFIEEIIDNVAFKSHSRAVKELKTYFGGEEVLSKTQTKAAKRIIKEASKPQAMSYSQQSQGNPWMPSSFLPPPMMGMNSQFFPQPPYQMTQPPIGPPGIFAGTCYKCNQQGHMARNCPTTMRRNPSQGGGARGSFRGRSFRRGRG